jgi:hypothetical protein
VKYLSPINLNATYAILDGIGYPDKADKLLKAFIRELSDRPGVFDLTRNPFGADVTNPVVRGALETQAVASLPPFPSPGEAAKAIYKGSWSPEDERALAQLSAADFEAEQKAITTKAMEALKSIADSSPLNKFRMRKFGL